MQKVLELHQRLIRETKPTFRRGLIDEINWNDKGIAILGARGVGKTTLLLQYIKEQYGTSDKALYASMDHIMVQEYSIYEIAENHYNSGGTHLFLDEIHKYENWSTHLKSISDTFPDLHCVVSGSSMLQLYKSKADLSRRYISYELQGLSLREYIQIEQNKTIEIITLDDILTNHIDIAHDLNDIIKPIKEYKQYVQHGYYPIYLQGTTSYAQKLQNILNTILEVDLPIVTGLPVQNVSKIKRLINIISRSVPFQPNITKLAETLELSRTTLYQYIAYLSNSCIIHSLHSPNKSYKTLSKPDKIFLHNTNMSFSFGGVDTNIGCVRETFFLNQVRQKHKVHSVKKGDFIINEKHTVEIGGHGKKYKQIANIPDSYIIADDIIIGTGNKIPLWLFGFLY